MPKIAKSLTAIEVKRLTTPKLHAVGTVPGLLLDVKPQGSASWILRTMVGNRRADFGLGGYPGVTLAGAVEAARELKAKIRQGIDPTSERRANRNIVEWTFKRCAEAYIAGHRAEWKNAKHAQQWTNTLTTYVYPLFGNKHVKHVTVADVLAAIEPQWATKNETMNRVLNRIELVLSWAASRKYREKDNPATWKGTLDQTLPKPSKVHSVEHHPAIPIDEVNAFLVALRNIQGTSARCLEFVAMTACRSGEARLATWAEFDLVGGVWNIPPERMKSGRPHRVPLCEHVLEFLNSLPQFVGTGLVFPGRDGETALSDMALNMIMRRMEVKDKVGSQAVPHGLRSTFSDWRAERTAYPVNIIEMALAHSIGNDTVEAYRRGDLFDKRRQLMADWAAFIETKTTTGGNVIPIQQAA